MIDLAIRVRHSCPELTFIFLLLFLIQIGCSSQEPPCEPAVLVVQNENGERQIIDRQTSQSVDYVLLIGCKQKLTQISESTLDEIWLYFRVLLRTDPAKVMDLAQPDGSSIEVLQSVRSDINLIVGQDVIRDVLVLGFSLDDLHWLPPSEPSIQ
jgi:hypothetical protein